MLAPQSRLSNIDSFSLPPSASTPPHHYPQPCPTPQIMTTVPTPANSECSSVKSFSPSEPSSYLPLFYFNVFFACISFSLLLPSLAPYLTSCGAGDPSFLAWVVSIYSVGELIGSLLFGILYNHLVKISRAQGPKISMLLCIFVGLVGSLLYLLAYIYKKPNFVLIARLLQGIWTGK